MVVAVLVAGEAAARVVGPHIPRTAGTEERLLVKSDQIAKRGTGATDVVVLGSSETAGGVIPSSMTGGLDDLDGVYNAALSGSELTFMREWADRIVAPGLHPKVAVIGLLPMSVQRIEDVRGAEEQEAALGAYRSAIEQVDPGGLGTLGWKLRQHSALIRYRPYLRSPRLALRGAYRALRGGDEVTDADRALDAKMDWTKETDPRRVARNTGHDGEVYDYREQTVDTPSDPVGARLYEYFGRRRTTFADLDALVRTLRSHGIQPVVAVAPVDRTPLEAAGADLAPLDGVARDIEAWGRRRGVPVDQQFTEDWSSDLFHDRNHLDLAGSQRWSAHLARTLQGWCTDGELGDAC